MKKIIIISILCLLLPLNNIFSQTTPNITQQPQDQTVTIGQTATFTITATCPDPIEYEWWRVPWVNVDESRVVDIPGKIEGSTTNQLRILNTTVEDNGTQYLCEAYNPLDHTNLFVNSNEARLTVIETTITNVILTNQAKVVAFGATNPKTITGYLLIQGEDITDLTPLSTITSIGGDLNLDHTRKLINVDGLNNIISIGGSLAFGYNDGLTNIDGLSNLRSIGGDLNFGYLLSLTNIDGLSNISSIGGSLTIGLIYHIANLDGLSNLTSIGGGLMVSQNQTLTNLDGLSNLKSVPIELYIYGNQKLINLDGLSNITSVGGNITVSFNQALTNIDGLSNITFVGGGIDLAFNQELTNLNGLEGLTFVDDVIAINHNYALTNLDGLSNINYVGNYLRIYDNGSLTNLDGLKHITSIGGILAIGENSNLINLNGLSNLTFVGGNLYVESNGALSEFCGLFPLLNFEGLVGIYSVSGNLINPTEQQILDIGSCNPIWENNLFLSDQKQQILLSYGISINATSEIDEIVGESELPPAPPTGTFDARFVLEDNSSTLLDLRNSDEKEIVWTIQFQPSSSGYPITLSWDNTNLPFGSFFLKDIITGEIVNIDMKLQNNFSLTNEFINKLKIVYKEVYTATSSYNKDWDLVSVPLKAESMEVSSLFSESTSNAFYFEGSYKSTKNLENGKGYWLKFPENITQNIYGDKFTEPIKVKKGWNIIGGNNEEIPISNLSSNPAGIISSNIYGFDSGYSITDKLVPGYGYWVKTSEDGELNFSGSKVLSKINKNLLKINNEPFIKIPITANDGVGDTILLNVGLDSLATNGLDENLGEQELPPLPPLGAFDIRFNLPDTNMTTFSDYRFTEANCFEHEITYQLGDSSNGLSLSWDLPAGVTLKISDMFGGTIFNESFESGKGSYTITNTNINNAKLSICYSDKIFTEIKLELIPTEYSLSQNYPNPFNPTTKIRFGIPKESKVTLTVYNILGEKIIELVNQQLKVGYHEVEYNALEFSSGIYFYRLQAGDFVETKKMILLK